MDRKAFFDKLRTPLFGGSISADQVQGVEALLDACEAEGVTDSHAVAYVLATVWHETAHTMQPIAEYGKGKGRKYGVPGRNGGQIPYGRGFVQTTWDENYERTDRELGLNGQLIANYNLLLTDVSMAAKAAVEGMKEGWYTGKKLSDYFHSGAADYVNARKIINGLDRADKIAGYARLIYGAMA